MAANLSPARLPAAEPTPDQLEHGTSLWRDAWHRLARNRLAVFGGVSLLVLTLACVFGPWLSPYSYEQQNLNLGATGPDALPKLTIRPYGCRQSSDALKVSLPTES